MILRHVLFSVLTCVLISFSYAQPSPPKDASSKKQDRAQDKRGTDVQPLVIKVVPSQASENQADQNERYREKQLSISGVVGQSLKDIARDSYINLWLTGSLLLVAIRQLWYFKKQLGVMAQTIDHMGDVSKKELRAHVFIDTASIVNVANPLPEYVHVPNPNFAAINFPAGPMVNLVIRNFGKTPAYDVMHWANIHFAEFPLKSKLPPRIRTPKLPMTRATIGPGGVTTKSIRMDQQLTDAQIAELRGATHAIYVYGNIVYRDVFGERQKTNFRMMHIALGNAIGISTFLTGCEEGNDAT